MTGDGGTALAYTLGKVRDQFPDAAHVPLVDTVMARQAYALQPLRPVGAVRFGVHAGTLRKVRSLTGVPGHGPQCRALIVVQHGVGNQREACGFGVEADAMQLRIAAGDPGVQGALGTRLERFERQ